MTGASTLRPDAARLADAAGELAGAYVHIPFCARVCPYCDFAVVAGRDDLVERYVAAVIAEIGGEEPFRPLDSVFVGGGTPSRIPVGGLARILAALDRRFGLGAGAEISLEANPEDWTPRLGADLAAAGFTRLSLGAQSFDPAVLAELGRVHTPADIFRAVSEAHTAGFASVNVDLIFGSPAETDASWEGSVRGAVASGVEHVSTYALTVEAGTELSRSIRAGEPSPDPDVQADRWERAEEILGTAGLVRYEVSNFARPGHACLHNLGVWDRGEYVAFGTGAHSFRHGIRRRNIRRIDAYLERVESGVGPVQGTEEISGWAGEQERLMLGLRRTAGVVGGSGGTALLASDRGRRLVEAGVVAVVGERLVVTRALLTDEVVRAVLDLDEPAG